MYPKGWSQLNPLDTLAGWSAAKQPAKRAGRNMAQGEALLHHVDPILDGRRDADPDGGSLHGIRLAHNRSLLFKVVCALDGFTVFVLTDARGAETPRRACARMVEKNRLARRAGLETAET